MTPSQERIARAAFEAYLEPHELAWREACESERHLWLGVARAVINAIAPAMACDNSETKDE